MQRFIDTVNGESFSASGQRPRKKQWLLGGAAAASVIAILTLLWSGEASTPPVSATPSHDKARLELAQQPLDVAQHDEHAETPAASASPMVGATAKQAEARTDESSANATRTKASASKKAHVSPKPKKPKHDFGF